MLSKETLKLIKEAYSGINIVLGYGPKSLLQGIVTEVFDEYIFMADTKILEYDNIGERDEIYGGLVDLLDSEDWEDYSPKAMIPIKDLADDLPICQIE